MAQQVAAFCRDRAAADAQTVAQAKPSPLWEAFVAAGTQPWLDTGDIEGARALWSQGMQGLTTNNTLLNAEIQKGIYDGVVPDAAALLRGLGVPEGQAMVLEVAFILNAIHGLKLVQTFGARVSVELHTDLARDIEASYRYGKRYASIEPDRFIVKVPLTPEGVLAARRLANDGIPVNFTLGFSARQNLVISRLARPAFVNVFMGRLNSFVADNGYGDGNNVGEKATLASQRMLRDQRDKHGVPSLQIGASIRSGQQCLDLAGLDVQTIPLKAAEQVVQGNADPSAVTDHTGEDPLVTFADGVDPLHAGLHGFWAIEPSLEAALDALEDGRVDSWGNAPDGGDQLRSHLEAHGHRNIFPTLNEAERTTISVDGKIPKADAWRSRVEGGTAGWDSLLTEAALAAFTADQTALDQRVSGLLG